MGGHHNPKLKLGENERGSRTLAANVTISDFCKRLKAYRTPQNYLSTEIIFHAPLLTQELFSTQTDKA